RPGGAMPGSLRREVQLQYRLSTPPRSTGRLCDSTEVGVTTAAWLVDADAAASRRRRLAPLLPAVGVALATFLWLNHYNPPFAMTDDGIRDQLLARDCTDLGRCHLIGAPTSVPGVHQGAVWIDLLIAVRLLGGDTATERTVVLALLAASVA